MSPQASRDLIARGAAPRRRHDLRLERRPHARRWREAAQACGREVVVVGRAMDRVIDVASECGYLDGLPEFRPPTPIGYLPRDKVVALLTGSQGEPRAALARIAARRASRHRARRAATG